MWNCAETSQIKYPGQMAAGDGATATRASSRRTAVAPAKGAGSTAKKTATSKAKDKATASKATGKTKRARSTEPAAKTALKKRRKDEDVVEISSEEDEETGAEDEDDGDEAGSDYSEGSDDAKRGNDKVTKSGKRRKDKVPEKNEDGEDIFCECRDVWDGVEFMIQCDSCGEWCVCVAQRGKDRGPRLAATVNVRPLFIPPLYSNKTAYHDWNDRYHGLCVGITAARGKKMDEYECDACAKKAAGKDESDQENGKQAGHQTKDSSGKAHASSTKTAPSSKAAHKSTSGGGSSKTSGKDNANSTTPAKIEDPWDHTVPDKTDNGLRLTARKGFETVFSEFFPSSPKAASSESPDGSPSLTLDAAGYAGHLETYMYLALREPATFQPGEKYKAQYRTLRLNLKDASNSTLRSRILRGELLPETLATLTPVQMASEEALKLAEEIRQQSLKEVFLKEKDSGERTVIRKTHKGEEEVVVSEISDSNPVAAEKPLKVSTSASALSGGSGGASDRSPISAPLKTADSAAAFESLLDKLDHQGSPTSGDRPALGKLSPPHSPTGPGSPVMDYDADMADPEPVPAKIPAPAKPTHDPAVWRGTLQMPQVASFKCQARQIAGRRLNDAVDGHQLLFPSDMSWSEVLYPDLQIDGRVGPDKVIDYLVQQTYSTTKEVVVIQFENEPSDESVTPPSADSYFTDFDRSEYKALFDYFHSRKRYGVIGPSSRSNLAKDIYVVPLKKHEPLPDFMDFVGGSSLKDGVKRERDLLLGVAVLVKQKPEVKVRLEIEPAVETVSEAQQNADEALRNATAALGNWDSPVVTPPSTLSLTPNLFDMALPVGVQAALPGFAPPVVPTMAPAVSGLQVAGLQADPLAGLNNVNLSNLLNQIQNLNQVPLPPPTAVPTDPRLARAKAASAAAAPAPAPVAAQDPSLALQNILASAAGWQQQPQFPPQAAFGQQPQGSTPPYGGGRTPPYGGNGGRNSPRGGHGRPGYRG